MKKRSKGMTTEKQQEEGGQLAQEHGHRATRTDAMRLGCPRRIGTRKEVRHADDEGAAGRHQDHCEAHGLTDGPPALADKQHAQQQVENEFSRQHQSVKGCSSHFHPFMQAPEWAAW
ncbi:MAG: hypothetical protein M5R42_20520 [Rhodocyclaceae bacterium]|nr:hypothetical protein [Rhodocyclaceae bacterium]